MPYYMHQWVYKDSQIRKIVMESDKRWEVVRIAVDAFGGKLHQFFFCLGDFDAVSISEFADDETALGCLMAIVAQGGVAVMKSVQLLTEEEAHRAIRRANQILTKK